MIQTLMFSPGYLEAVAILFSLDIESKEDALEILLIHGLDEMHDLLVDLTLEEWEDFLEREVYR